MVICSDGVFHILNTFLNAVLSVESLIKKILWDCIQGSYKRG